MPAVDKDFALHVQLLTNTVRAAIRNALRNFEEDTGVTPCGIDVHLAQEDGTGAARTRYVLADVKVRFDL